MKRHLFLSLCSLFVCVISFAQTNLYTETKVFNETDYIYQCEIDSTDFVVLYNKDYQLTPDDVKGEFNLQMQSNSNLVILLYCESRTLYNALF